MMANIICCDSNGNPIDHFTQWDVNQKLYIKGADMSSTPLFHFCNEHSDEALPVLASVDGDSVSAIVPNELLQHSSPLTVHLYYGDEDGARKTTNTVRIPVNPRHRPADYIYSGGSSGGSLQGNMNIIVSDTEPMVGSVLWFDTGLDDE